MLFFSNNDIQYKSRGNKDKSNGDKDKILTVDKYCRTEIMWVVA